MLIALLSISATTSSAVVAFLLFRAFDILKPFPAARLEKLAGGWGVMLDDAVAGVYANVTLRLLQWAVPT